MSEPAPDSMSGSAAAANRSALRAFIREYHPDVGGDPEEFIAGLSRLRAAGAHAGGPAADDPRLNAPVIIVVTPSLPVALIRQLARSLRRRLPSYLLGAEPPSRVR